MRYLQMVRVGVAVGVLLGLGHAMMLQIAGPEDRVYGFIYQRGPVQHVILGVATFALVLLYCRLREYHRTASGLRAFEREEGDPVGPLAEVTRRAGQLNTDRGATAVRSYVERFHAEQSNAVQNNYDLIRFVVGTLPALGLLGTVLGLSDALFAAFSRGFGTESVGKFVEGLSTALDTTVLAMLCAGPLFAWMALQTRQEYQTVDRHAEFLRRRFGLAEVPDGDKGTHVIYTELCRLTKRIGEDAKAMFGEMLDTSGAALRETLGEAVQKHLTEHHQAERESVRDMGQQIADQWDKAIGSMTRRQQQQHRDLAEGVCASIAQHVAQPVQAVAETMQDYSDRMSEHLPQVVSRAMADVIGQTAELFDHRQASLAERMTHHMGRLETAIRKRTPEEVIIRYQGNGSTH